MTEFHIKVTQNLRVGLNVKNDHHLSFFPLEGNPPFAKKINKAKDTTKGTFANKKQ